MAEAEKKKPSSVKASQKAPSLAAQKRKDQTKPKDGNLTIQCTMHGGNPLSVANFNFYKANKGSIFGAMGYIPVCTKCIKKMYNEYYHSQGKDVYKAIMLMCRRIDAIYSTSAVEGALKRNGDESDSIVGVYLGIVNSLSQYTEDSNFDSSDAILTDEQSIEAIAEKRKASVKLDADDKRNIKDIKKKLNGLDPFVGYEYKDYDLKMMYQDLVGFLEDDDIATEPYKLNTVLQVINNNHQIRNYDLYISILNNNLTNFKDNLATLTSISNQKSKRVEDNLKIFDKNKWLTSDGGSSKSKLAGMMKTYRELGFDEADANYFKMKTAESCKSVQDISNRSIMDTIRFSEQDEKEIFRIQRELIQRQEDDIIQAKEENKQLARELNELKQKLGADS